MLTPTITFRQLDALYWIGRLGSFEAAARRLEISQSSMTRRIQDLEVLAAEPLFDRSQRTPTLTAKGQELCRRAGELIAQRDGFAVAMAGAEAIPGDIAMGVTEIAALSWLARFLSRAAKTHPNLTIRPRVAPAATLQEEVVRGALDLAVIPQSFVPPQLDRLALAQLTCLWVCPPGLIPDGSVREIGDLTAVPMPMLVQDNLLFARMMGTAFADGAPKPEIIVADSLLALIAMCIAGAGFTLLPEFLVRSSVLEGQLQQLLPEAPAPSLAYHMLYRRNDRRPGIDALASLLGDICRFDAMFLADAE